MDIQKDDWLGILTCLFEMHMGRSDFDEDAWLEDFEKGRSPYDAFYDEYPEYDGLED